MHVCTFQWKKNKRRIQQAEEKGTSTRRLVGYESRHSVKRRCQCVLCRRPFGVAWKQPSTRASSCLAYRKYSKSKEMSVVCLDTYDGFWCEWFTLLLSDGKSDLSVISSSVYFDSYCVQRVIKSIFRPLSPSPPLSATIALSLYFSSRLVPACGIALVQTLPSFFLVFWSFGEIIKYQWIFDVRQMCVLSVSTCSVICKAKILIGLLLCICEPRSRFE